MRYEWPFLCSGITLAIFNFLGNIPVTSDWLNIRVSGEIRLGAKNFKNLVEMPSNLDESLVRSDVKIFMISS